MADQTLEMKKGTPKVGMAFAKQMYSNPDYPNLMVIPIRRWKYLANGNYSVTLITDGYTITRMN